MLNPINDNNFSSMKMLVVLLALIFLGACSGGGGGSNFGPRVDQEAAGAWSGTITSDNAGGPFQLAGIVTETGEVQFTSGDGATVYTGTIQVDGDKITGTLEGVNFAGILPNALPAGSIDIDGTVTSQGAITGTYVGANDSGTFSVAYSDSYERSADLGKLASDWTSIGNLVFKSGIGGENEVLAITVDDMGNLSGGDTGGCSYGGTFSVNDPDVNAYNVQLDVTDCGGLNGAYTGLATLTDDAGPNDTLALSASNLAIAIAFSADRISSRSAAGIWTGTITSDMDMVAEPIWAIIAESDDSVFITDDATQLSGPIQVSGNFLDSTVNAYASEGDLFPDGTSFGSLLLRGLVDTAVSLELSFDGVGDTGQILLAYDPIYEAGSALATVEGDWSFDNGAGDTLNISIDAAGAISGSDSEGCTYTGTIAIQDPAFNAYDVNVTLAGCADAGDYSGLAAVLDDVAPGDTLLVGVSNPTLEEALSVGLTRVVP